jgi:DNA-binding MarR family transcriptional regulator
MSSRDVALSRISEATRTLIRNVETVREAAAKALGLHPTDMAAIEYLYRAASPVSVKQVITHMKLTSSSGTALLDRLEAAGYIKRMANPDDRRSLLVQLEPHRMEGPIRRFKSLEKVFHQSTVGLSDENLGIVADFLESIGTITLSFAEADDVLA